MATTIETADITLIVDKREDKGTNPSGRLRAEGRVPAVVYGGDKPSASITVEEDAVRELLRNHGENIIFLLKLADTDEERRAMIREIQADPISGKFFHIDFIRITRGHKITVAMPVELTGDIGQQMAARCAICGSVLAREGVCPKCLDRKKLAWRMIGFVRPYIGWAVLGLLLAGF